MGWLIAIGIAQLVVLIYIAMRLELLLRGDDAARFTNLVLAQLRSIQGGLPMAQGYTDL